PPCAVGGHNHDRARNAGPCLNVARMRASLTGSLTLVSLLAVVTGTGLSVTWIELLTSDPIESTACFPPSSSAPSLAPACKRRMNTSRELNPAATVSTRHPKCNKFAQYSCLPWPCTPMSILTTFTRPNCAAASRAAGMEAIPPTASIPSSTMSSTDFSCRETTATYSGCEMFRRPFVAIKGLVLA
ncbi:unnamed protein product, partial [Ectocarpus sp. 12 AP-2014]